MRAYTDSLRHCTGWPAADMSRAAELMIKTQRNGPTGDVKFTWLHDFTRFENSQHVPYDEFAEFDAGTF
jgi:replicative DNA helicase